MKTAIITGASAGLGREFLRHLPTLFPDIEEYWLVSRSKDKLTEAAREVPRQCRIFPLDLTLDESYEKFAAELNRVMRPMSNDPMMWTLYIVLIMNLSVFRFNKGYLLGLAELLKGKTLYLREQSIE